jgi:hypothetical protein
LQNKLAALAVSETTTIKDHASTLEDENPSLDAASSSPVVQVCISQFIESIRKKFHILPCFCG